MKKLFDDLSLKCSRLTTRTYSTSFSVGIRCLDRSLQDPIHSIYGFVRFADEIVDSFHDCDKPAMLARFRDDTRIALETGVSINPILNSFQATVRQYNIELRLIDQFLESMEMDLSKKDYTTEEYERYIAGSAEAVGLMCLKVFTQGDDKLYADLEHAASKLGAAFQKVNFLRDLDADLSHLGRTYLPGVDAKILDEKSKKKIEDSIARDFAEAFEGICRLPKSARFGVYVAYVYYFALFRKIRNMPSHKVLKNRVRIHNREKATLLAYSFVKYQLNLI